MTENTTTSNLSFKDKAGVFFWRKMMMPLIAAIGSKKYPLGKVKEFAYGSLKDEKLDFITPNTNSKKKGLLFIFMVVHG